MSGRSEVCPKMELDLGGAVSWRVVEEFFRAHTHIHRLVIFARPCEKVPFLRFPRPGVRGNVYDYCPDVSFRSPGSGVEVRGTRTWVRFMFM